MMARCGSEQAHVDWLDVSEREARLEEQRVAARLVHALRALRARGGGSPLLLCGRIRRSTGRACAA